MNAAIKQTTDGVIIDVVIRPRSSRDEIVGLHGDALKIKITAPPVDGRANAHLIAFLADILGVAKSAITILRGETGSRKTLAIRGISIDEVVQRTTT